MNKCDCRERIGIKINTYRLYEELKKFFDDQVSDGTFDEEFVEAPYYTGYEVNETELSLRGWYADRWFKCNCCGTLWEFSYPEFPAWGFVRKFSDGIYRVYEKDDKGFDIFTY